MRNRLFIIPAAIFFTALSGTSPAASQSWYGNSAIRNPIGPATVPQSSFRSGLFPSPNPIDTTGNLLITGNVAGGKHFRGTVPYSATSSFAGTAGSTTLDSFLRRSAGSGGIGNLPGRYTPYYSPSGTVTTTRPGLSSFVRPPTASTEGRTVEEFTVPAIPQQPTLAGPEMSTPSISYRPMRFKPQQLEKLILDGVLTYAEAKRLVDEQNQAQMERLQRDLAQLQHRAPTLKQSLIVRDESLRPFSKLEQGKEALKSFELQKPKEQPVEESQWATTRDAKLLPDQGELIKLRAQEQADEAGKAKKGGRELDVYERMQRQIENMQNEYTKLDTQYSKQDRRIDSEEPKAKKSTTDILIDQMQMALAEDDEEMDALEAELIRDALSKKLQEEISDVVLSLRAKSIMGEHKTFASYAEDKFNQHMRAAEQYLKEGKYYRAADTYTLASLYKRDDPLAYAGKSHALFAAGGYTSSALFLSRALEIFPEYARFKIDLVGMVGDRDKVESRIVDIKEWIEISGSAELQFLLGYVYYQIGRVNEAKKAIDAAYEKLPEAPAVNALKKAIDIAITEHRKQKTEDR